jgi:hypothetical protein
MPESGGRASTLPPRAKSDALQASSANEARTRGEFRAQAILIRERSHLSDNAGSQANYGDSADHDTELGSILDAIAEDVARMSAGASAAAMAEYAGATESARKQFPKHLVAGIIRGLKDALQAKLAAIKDAAKIELAGRREAAVRAHHGRRPHVVARKPPSPNQG